MQSSAFDEALALPFLEERQKKKWSIASTSSTEATTIATTKSMLDDSDYSYDDDLEDPFAGLVAIEHANETAQLVQMETIIFGDEEALARERHGELMGINDSLKQINTIHHHDLAGIVQAQDIDIKRMSWFAIETFENTESGLEQVVRAARYSDSYQYSQRRKTLGMVLFGVIALLGFSRSVLVRNSDQQQTGNTQVESPHASNTNQLHTPMIYIPDSDMDGMMQP